MLAGVRAGLPHAAPASSPDRPPAASENLSTRCHDCRPVSPLGAAVRRSRGSNSPPAPGDAADAQGRRRGLPRPQVLPSQIVLSSARTTAHGVAAQRKSGKRPMARSWLAVRSAAQHRQNRENAITTHGLSSGASRPSERYQRLHALEGAIARRRAAAAAVTRRKLWGSQKTIGFALGHCRGAAPA